MDAKYVSSSFALILPPPARSSLHIFSVPSPFLHTRLPLTPLAHRRHHPFFGRYEPTKFPHWGIPDAMVQFMSNLPVSVRGSTVKTRNWTIRCRALLHSGLSPTSLPLTHAPLSLDAQLDHQVPSPSAL